MPLSTRACAIFNQRSRGSWRLLGGLALGCWSLTLAAQELIVNDALPHRAISRNEARLWFTMRLTAWENAPVTVYVLPDEHPLHRQFAKQVLGFFPYQLRQVWDRQIFSGTGQAPVMVTSEQEMIDRVAATPGGIGYIASGSPHPGARLVQIR